MKVWAVTIHVPYSDGWLDSLWITEDLARAKIARDRANDLHKGCDAEIEEFELGSDQS